MWNGFISIIINVYLTSWPFFPTNSIQTSSWPLYKINTKSQKTGKPEHRLQLLKVIVAVLVAVFRPAINGGKYTKCFITHTPHVPARNRDRANFRTRQMCPQCKQNAHVNYTGQQEPRNKRTLTTKANRSLWLRVFVFLCELKMTHFESKRSKIETHTIKRRKIKKAQANWPLKEKRQENKNHKKHLTTLLWPRQKRTTKTQSSWKLQNAPEGRRGSPERER